MRFICFAAALALAPSLAFAQDTASQTMTGAWTGAFASGGQLSGFAMSLRQEPGGAFTGTASEPATFGDGTVMFLTSTVRGEIAGKVVRFTKTYDGSGGVSHSVTYQGRLDRTNRRVTGMYDVGGTTGAFEMAK